MSILLLVSPVQLIHTTFVSLVLFLDYHSSFLSFSSLQRDAAWAQETPIAAKTLAKLGGMKQAFERPGASKRKRDY